MCCTRPSEQLEHADMLGAGPSFPDFLESGGTPKRRGSPVPPLPPRKAVVSISAPQRILDSSERILGRTEGGPPVASKGHI